MFERHYRNVSTNSTFFAHTERGYFSRYPLASGVLAVPIYVVPVLLLETINRPTSDDWIKVAVVMEKISGALITSLSVGVFWLLAQALGANRMCAAALTIAYAFGSEAWGHFQSSTLDARPGVLFILLSLKLAEAPSSKRALLVGLCCGIAIAVRVNNVLFVGPLLCWILIKDRRSFLWCTVPVLILGTLLAAYNYAMFGNLTGSNANAFNGVQAHEICAATHHGRENTAERQRLPCPPQFGRCKWPALSVFALRSSAFWSLFMW